MDVTRSRLGSGHAIFRIELLHCLPQAPHTFPEESAIISCKRVGIMKTLPPGASLLLNHFLLLALHLLAPIFQELCQP